ncbi:MAG TPA: hypothetical protein VH165_32725 [Kofleriaceae bacterium]|nr:hypothetical protein [Kofleriaceae bacterium]
MRALDAFHEFYHQLDAITLRVNAAELALSALDQASAVLAVADLNCVWALLEARLELLEAVTNDDAGRDLWTLPAIAIAREASRKVLALGARYERELGSDATALLVQLHQLAARLVEQERVAVAMQHGSHAKPGRGLRVSAGAPTPSASPHVGCRQRSAVIRRPGRSGRPQGRAKAAS